MGPLGWPSASTDTKKTHVVQQNRYLVDYFVMWRPVYLVIITTDDTNIVIVIT